MATLHLKLKMGMPLLGWRRKARGVSSTSTVRRMSRPSRERSWPPHPHLILRQGSGARNPLEAYLTWSHN